MFVSRWPTALRCFVVYFGKANLLLFQVCTHHIQMYCLYLNTFFNLQVAPWLCTAGNLRVFLCPFLDEILTALIA